MSQVQPAEPTATPEATGEQQFSSTMATAFDPHPVETKWTEEWATRDIGAGRTPAPGERAYCITIPPPNVTGVLHLGHALQHSIHDCLIRYHRMKGLPTLCVPGTDHAGIGTQIKVEAELYQSEGKTRHDLGREAFEARTWEWKAKYGGTIIEQMKALGCSYDWSRERFTMDEGYVRAVLTVFKAWYDRGLIYRGYRLVNWSSGAHTTVSDLEIEYKEVDGQLTYIRYPVEGSEEFVVVATTRPETMLGDTAVAVHPEDPRYAHLRGKNVILPLQNRPIPLVFDDKVDKEFGTGAVKITPAHDPNDYEMGTRHGLPMITVIGFDDKMTAEAGTYAGRDKKETRRAVVRDLKAAGLIEKIEPYKHSVGHCARTGVVIEPLLSEQWFVAMKELARPVADCLRMDRIEFVPGRFVDTCLERLDNIRDWCISRQLWWGHRIPIWYGPGGEVGCTLDPVTEPGWTQDADVLDTWFSSALWPFAVLGWPDQLERDWYPTNVLITGRDILNLWVSRMVLTSLDFVKNPDSPGGEIPFHTVFVHPTVQDVLGRRMSKSLGTGIDPMELINTYGADATRFGLLQLTTGNQDVRFIDQALSQLGETGVKKWIHDNPGQPLPLVWEGKPTERYPQMQSARNFANKIWNASRLVLSGNAEAHAGGIPDDLASRWILSRLNGTIGAVTSALDGYEFEAAGNAIYSFIWGDFCDWFLEVSKNKMRSGDTAHIAFMADLLERALRLLHPFMPFISEEIWAQLPGHDGELLALQSWPEAGPRDLGAEADFTLIQEAVRAARNLRAEASVPPSRRVKITFVPRDNRVGAALAVGEPYLQVLANLETVTFAVPGEASTENALVTSLSDLDIILPLEGLVDVEKERARLQKQAEISQKELAGVEAKWQNPNFVARAPREVLQKAEQRRDELTLQIAKLLERIAAL